MCLYRHNLFRRQSFTYSPICALTGSPLAFANTPLGQAGSMHACAYVLSLNSVQQPICAPTCCSPLQLVNRRPRARSGTRKRRGITGPAERCSPGRPSSTGTSWRRTSRQRLRYWDSKARHGNVGRAQADIPEPGPTSLRVAKLVRMCLLPPLNVIPAITQNTIRSFCI